MPDIVLYDFWRSSASYRVRIALNLAGLDYKAVPIDLTRQDQKTDDHVARNPQGFVPVLDIDGMRMTQSLAILQYLDTTRGLTLYPTDPAERAAVEAAAHAIAVDIHPVCNLQVAVHASELTGDPQTRVAWMRRFIRPGLVAFEALLQRWAGAPFCCGDAPGIADVCLMPQVYNARRWGAEIEDLPRVMAAVTACEAVPAFQAALPEAVAPA